MHCHMWELYQYLHIFSGSPIPSYSERHGWSQGRIFSSGNMNPLLVAHEYVISALCMYVQ